MKNVIKLCAVLCVLQMSSVAIAQDTNWTNVGGDAEWTNDTNWSSGHAVGGTNFLTNIALPAANVTTPGVLASRLVLDTGGAINITAAGSLDVVGGGSQILMGNGPGSSTINVDGSLSNANVFAVGTNPGGVGTLTVGATGSVDVNNAGAWLIAGFGGAGAIGTIDVNGGSVTVAGFMAAGWAGTGTVNVNGGGSISVEGNFLIGGSGGDGSVVINDGIITAGGLNNAIGSLLMEDGTTFMNIGGYGAGGTVTINDTAQFIFANSPLADVQQLVLVDDSANWNFNIGPSIFESGGNVIVTNIPEPTSLVLLSSMAWMGLAVRRRR